MTAPPPDAPEDVSSGVFASADSEPIESPSVAPVAPPSPKDVACDNARNGRWAMNEYYDGCVLLGADDRPVMRNDGSRVGFFFRDAQRMADELAAGSEPGALPSGNDADERAAAWRAHRRALAPLDAGFNKDWDPQRPKSTRADMTKWTRLLAYYYVQSTEPEEAVRHAVSDIFGKPLNGLHMRLWVPGKHNPETIKAVADGLMRQVLGEDMAEAVPATNLAMTSVVDGMPTSGGDPNANLIKIASATGSQTRVGDERLVQASTRPGVNNRQIDNHFDRKQWDWVKNVDERNNSVSFITGNDTIAIDASGIAYPLTNQFYYKVFVTPLNEDDSPQSSLATQEWFEPKEYTSGFTGGSYKMISGQRVIQANAPGAKKFKWTIILPPQESTHGNTVANSHMLEVFKPRMAR